MQVQARKGVSFKYPHPTPRHARRATGITFRQQKRRGNAHIRAAKKMAFIDAKLETPVWHGELTQPLDRKDFERCTNS